MIFFFLGCIPYFTSCATLIEEARAALEVGKYSEALSIYDKAINENNKNHVAYYLRASLNEVLGRYPQSISDLTKAIEINPSFLKAKMNRALLLIKQGELDKAMSDINEITHTGDTEFVKQCQDHRAKINDMKKHQKDFVQHYNSRRCKEAIESSTPLIEAIPLDAELRRKRISCFETLQQHDQLLNELNILSQITPNDLGLSQKIANLYYETGQIDESNTHVKKCLKSDPENSACMSMHKRLKTLKKTIDQIEEDIKKENYKSVEKRATSMNENFKDSTFGILQSRSYLCRAYHKLNKNDEALPHCSFVIRENGDDIEARLTRADIYITRELYDEAKSDYNAILEKHQNHQRAQEGLSRIEKILKNKSRRDYYKILNVSRSATTQEIEKAYRALVKIWHPDHFRDEEKIKIANNKLQELNQARSVLTDAQKRKRFDDGFDPLDPDDQRQNNGGGGSYGHQDHGSFFNFFQGGHQGGHFRFNFG